MTPLDALAFKHGFETREFKQVEALSRRALDLYRRVIKGELSIYHAVKEMKQMLEGPVPPAFRIKRAGSRG